jgi:hypothetical protein
MPSPFFIATASRRISAASIATPTRDRKPEDVKELFA